MSYFDPTRHHHTYQPPFQPEPAPQAQAYPVDEDGDRIYTEEDYAIKPDGDAFLPDDDEQADFNPFVVSTSPLSYTGMYDSMNLQEDEAQRDDFEDYDEEDFLTDEEREELRRSSWKLMAGLADFAGVILGTAVILILIALLVSLLNWLAADISQTFILLQTPQ